MGSGSSGNTPAHTFDFVCRIGIEAAIRVCYYPVVVFQRKETAQQASIMRVPQFHCGIAASRCKNTAIGTKSYGVNIARMASHLV